MNIVKWIFLLMVIFGVACAPVEEGAPPTGAEKQEENKQDADNGEPTSLVTGYDQTGVQIRVQNNTGVDFEAVTIAYPQETYEIGALADGEVTEFFTFSEAYQSPTLTADGYQSENLDMPAETGEPSITGGMYTVIMELVGDGILLGDLRPEIVSEVNNFDGFVTALQNAGLDVAYVQSVKRPTVFDTLFGRTITIRELFDSNNQRIELFIFPNAEMAAEAVATIQPGSNTLRLAGNSESLNFGSAVIPTWWHTDRLIVLVSGASDEMVTKISTALDSDPLTATDENRVNLRIHNRSESDFDRVTVQFTGEKVTYESIPTGATSGYMPFEMAFRYGSIEIEANGESYDIRAIDYVGETPLENGNYTLELVRNGRDIMQAIFSDDEHFVDDQLIGTDWFWVLARSSEDVISYPNILGSSERWPHVTFTSEPPLNPDWEVGLQFHGNDGCNGIGGTYNVNNDPVENVLRINGMGGTEMACEGKVMASAEFLTQNLHDLSRYFVRDDWLFIRTASGTLLTFTNERPATTPEPYDYQDQAALAPLLQAIFLDVYEFEVTRNGQTAYANAVGYDLAFFREVVNVYVFDSVESADNALIVSTFMHVWQHDNILISYSGDYELVNEVLQKVLE